MFVIMQTLIHNSSISCTLFALSNVAEENGEEIGNSSPYCGGRFYTV